MTLLESLNGGGFGVLIALIVGVMVGPALILFIISAAMWRKKKKLAKNLLIAGVLYLIIAGGICGIIT